ncbi:MAG: hypothetical protein DMF40_08590 [Verrucomicrobia bacterium]|nr:MAG: hypothetical protein DMF40_08590 [Verrucomicrobiota bacterium]
MATHSLHFLLVAVVGPVAAMAEKPLAKGIQDSSFLIEEAYNQEPGVVQHIFNLPSFFSPETRTRLRPASLRNGRSSAKSTNFPIPFRTRSRTTRVVWPICD